MFTQSKCISSPPSQCLFSVIQSSYVSRSWLISPCKFIVVKFVWSVIGVALFHPIVTCPSHNILVFLVNVVGSNLSFSLFVEFSLRLPTIPHLGYCRLSVQLLPCRLTPQGVVTHTFCSKPPSTAVHSQIAVAFTAFLMWCNAPWVFV